MDKNGKNGQKWAKMGKWAKWQKWAKMGKMGKMAKRANNTILATGNPDLQKSPKNAVFGGPKKNVPQAPGVHFHHGYIALFSRCQFYTWGLRDVHDQHG